MMLLLADIFVLQLIVLTRFVGELGFERGRRFSFGNRFEMTTDRDLRDSGSVYDGVEQAYFQRANFSLFLQACLSGVVFGDAVTCIN